ncbi:MAG: class I adenylate cyclase [Desulfobacterales bacterium]|nr:class I adenylate cyclase [Desulfobacterales bacterium]
MDKAQIFNNPNRLEFYWEQIGQNERLELISEASDYDSALGIPLIILGLSSPSRALNSQAKIGLSKIQEILVQDLERSAQNGNYFKAYKIASKLSAGLYRSIFSYMPLGDKAFLFTQLLKLEDAGAIYAFKSLLIGKVSIDELKEFIFEEPEPLKLCLLGQYLQASPETRLKFAKVFKEILKSIRYRRPVISFYAGLFDRKQDVDPFLSHIDPVLRDPKILMEGEASSGTPETMVIGLKALAMMIGKIPSDLLIDSLDSYGGRKVRITVYNIVENSSMGLYPEMFDPIWQLFVNSDSDEALAAFKALVLCGKIPLLDLMGRVKENHPGMIPAILREVSTLSRTSFFFIQDIALNKQQYRTDRFGINMACVLGIVRKRPERVVRIIGHGGRAMKNEEKAFIEKAKQLLIKEKKSIEPARDTEVDIPRQKSPKPKRLFKSFFKDPEKEKFNALKRNIPSGSLNFQGRLLEGSLFSGLKFSASILYFNDCMIKNGDWSKISVSRAFFKGSRFLKMDLTHACFEGVHFDNAVLFNVNAQGAVFNKCSFQGAQLFNCNFDGAEFKDTDLTCAQISKCTFKDANLSYASLAHANISGVSFDTASLDHADLSFVKARFSRFPAYTGSDTQTRGIDYNARQYQLRIKDFPKFSESVVSEINILIFSEFVRYGQRKFLNQNKLSLLTAYDLFTPLQADLFQIIPVLIHENIDIRGANRLFEDTPCGISDFCPSKQAVAIVEKYSLKPKISSGVNPSPCIEALYTMGSVGSLAQTTESDIDYWVCIYENKMSVDQLKRFVRKLRMIERMAKDRFKIQVTFFVVDIHKAKVNDFGQSTRESSGTAQARLLKEEFYRTMIHVAGKLPLWSVIPTGISINYYHTIRKHVSPYKATERYIDLGDIHAIPVNEYFGASIWQMVKWLKSPFKSVIKMALLELYIQSYGADILLCNQYKNEWMNSGIHLRFARNDSYIMVLDKLLAYYDSANDSQSINIILTCFFLKLEIAQHDEIDDTIFGIRRILVEKLLSDWGWNRRKIYEIGSFRNWNDAKIRRLSTSIEHYMLSKYEHVKKAFKNISSEDLMISQEDRDALKRKVDIVYKDKPNKIKNILMVSKSEKHFSNLNLRYHSSGPLSGKWELFNKDPKMPASSEESLIKAQTVEEIGAWLIYNGLYKADSTEIILVPNPTNVSHNDINNMYRAMQDFFSVMLNPTIEFYDLTESVPRIVAVFSTVNFYVSRSQTQVDDYCAIYLNSWGEMFYRISSTAKTFTNLASAKKEILSSMGITTFPAHAYFYHSKGPLRYR